MWFISIMKFKKSIRINRNGFYLFHKTAPVRHQTPNRKRQSHPPTKQVNLDFDTFQWAHLPSSLYYLDLFEAARVKAFVRHWSRRVSMATMSVQLLPSVWLADNTLVPFVEINIFFFFMRGYLFVCRGADGIWTDMSRVYDDWVVNAEMWCVFESIFDA